MKPLQLLLIALPLLVSSCGLADLRSATLKEQGITPEAEQRGRQLLEAAWLAQGMDQLDRHESYEIIGKDHWKGLLGKAGNPWPVNNKALRLQYSVGTFDGKFEVLEGKKEGYSAGLQSWHYYEQARGTAANFEVKPNEKHTFVLAAFQYFFELTDRLRNVPIVAYVGEKEFDGQLYQLVFASWEKAAPHPEHDQYVLYINNETRMVDYAEFTIRDTYLAGPKKFYGSIQYKDWKTIDGIKIPFTQLIYFNDPKEKEDQYLHRLMVDSFEFDSFDKAELYPNENLSNIGDDKLP
jgi:hypothetical protein